MACATKVNKNMSKKTREQDHQVNILNDKEKANILNEDKSRARIKECAEEVEKVLAKYGMTITPTLQITDVSFEREMLKQATEQPAAEIKK